MPTLSAPQKELDTAMTRASGAGRRWFWMLCLVVVAYALLAGLRTVTDFDLGWQMATGRWIAQHHQIPSVDVFSYTAPGRAWIYPVASGLIFYGTYWLGGWTLLSWLGAVVCAGTVCLLLRRGTPVAAALAVVVMPCIASHTTPRADMFTALLFAAFLSLLWEQHETGRAKLWLLPLLTIAWVNLHLGFVSGLALLAMYVAVEFLEMPWQERRADALKRLRASIPWLLLTAVATVVNPWGWAIYQAILRQNSAMAEHSQEIIEWAPVRLNWSLLGSGLWLRSPDRLFYVMLLLAGIAVVAALYRRQLGVIVLLVGAAWLSARHIRFQGLFAVVLVIVGGSVLHGMVKKYFEGAHWPPRLAIVVTVLVLALAGIRSFDVVTNRTYLSTTDLGNFGTGLSWWFPEGAAKFVEREKLPGELFHTYNEGGFVVWRLGERYRNYIDGRAIPFGPAAFRRNSELLGTLPDSAEWQNEVERYGINVVLVPLGRYNALQFFPVLRQFCSSSNWRPVYLDEVSAVFLRQTPQTEGLIQRLGIDCNTAPIPPDPPSAQDSQAFNRWANGAALLQALGRNREAFDATTRALAIFSDTAFVHFLRGNLLRSAGNLAEAEQQYRIAASLESNAATWSVLADLYRAEGRRTEEIDARERAIALLSKPGLALLTLGYTYLDTQRPQEALKTFALAESSLPGDGTDSSYLANLSHGRAMAWISLGNLDRAIAFEEQTIRLSPNRRDDWRQLADLYERAGRLAEARQARERAEMLNEHVAIPR